VGEDWEQEQRGEKEGKINEGDVEWVRLLVGKKKEEKKTKEKNKRKEESSGNLKSEVCNF
jgi:hypothetical protein